MKYLTTAQVAEKWSISDRRVRTLCSQGRIEGAAIKNGAYVVPDFAEKPADRRYRMAENAPKYLLKWENTTIAAIDKGLQVDFFMPEFNAVVEEYTRGEKRWSREKFETFLSERIAGKGRRDIERILFRCGLSSYDVTKLALATRGINSRDLLWIAMSEDEKMSDVMTDVFSAVFVKKTDLLGDSVDTPDGQNVKRYGVFNGKYGIYKNRLSPLMTDVESELAVFEIAKLMGVECCPVYRIDKDTVFSEFLYDFSNEYIVHMRQLVSNGRSRNEYYNLLAVRPQYQKEIIRMLVLDFVTRQDDRHLSNIAVKISGETTAEISTAKECFYPLYDNGRSLFYEDTEETAARAADDVKRFSTCFGPEGSYYEHLKNIWETGIDFSRIVNLNISISDIHAALKKAGLVDYRLEYGAEWVCKVLETLRNGFRQ